MQNRAHKPPTPYARAVDDIMTHVARCDGTYDDLEGLLRDGNSNDFARLIDKKAKEIVLHAPPKKSVPP